ncbi:MAG: AraC family transcriptional regulator [Muribaculaceae bacterium]|nr:AraC family transcriptional regulator [Muribaculaceae bacterium]
MSSIKLYKPHPALSRYVRYYWALKSTERFKVLTFPIGCPQIIFHKGSPLYIPETGSFQADCTISGQVNFPAHIQTCDNLDMLVAVFYPHSIGWFISTPPSEFYNLEISGFDVNDSQLPEVAMRILDCNDTPTCISIIERWLMSRISISVNIDRMSHAVDSLLLNPSTRITNLASSVCLGRKQFERIFNHHVGMNPKEYARIVRFQKSLWMMQNGVDNYLDIAYACGYSDQAHMIREFKTFSGHTPGDLSNHCAPYSDLFTNPV